MTDNVDEERASAWVLGDVDPERPDAARVYDYYLGGAHNFVVDREFAHQQKTRLPDVDQVALMNRRFLQRAVRELSALGVDQFLDLGSGIPTVGNVHEIAQQTNPRARVIYVDYEAVAVAQSQLLLADNEFADIVTADIREPMAVLDHEITRRLLDFGKPVGMIMCTILHFVPDAEEPERIVARYRDALAPGSYLAISHGTTDNRPDLQAFGDAYQQTPNPVTLRSKERIARFFDGFELIEPGIVFTPQWRPEHPSLVGEEPEKSGVYAAAGRKP
ncbi:MAG TPA: SAM-dependent methyltransferase [Pseudonocardiaceae bacterium]|jgi:hypothetical protein|nr:SAM-dependent methyltransferase [Pseudonocardiaceae bacterium]